jgi:hypothetical protein
VNLEKCCESAYVVLVAAATNPVILISMPTQLRVQVIVGHLNAKWPKLDK